MPPEKLLRAMLLQVFYSVRSERQLMQQAQYKLLFRWLNGYGDGYWRGVGAMNDLFGLAQPTPRNKDRPKPPPSRVRPARPAFTALM